MRCLEMYPRPRRSVATTLTRHQRATLVTLLRADIADATTTENTEAHAVTLRMIKVLARAMARSVFEPCGCELELRRDGTLRHDRCEPHAQANGIRLWRNVPLS